MMNKNQKGFSLIELIMVVAIIGVIATLAIPSLTRAKGASENGSAVALMRTIATTQMQYYSQNNRYARLDELNNSQNGVLGTFSGTTLRRGAFEYEMLPVPTPTDADLKTTFMVKATRVVTYNEPPYTITVDQTGEIIAVYAP